MSQESAVNMPGTRNVASGPTRGNRSKLPKILISAMVGFFLALLTAAVAVAVLWFYGFAQGMSGTVSQEFFGVISVESTADSVATRILSGAFAFIFSLAAVGALIGALVGSRSRNVKQG